MLGIISLDYFTTRKRISNWQATSLFSQFKERFLEKSINNQM